MKPEWKELPRLYNAALQKFLKGGPEADMRPAHVLGERAQTLGLEILDLARIHETAVNSALPEAAGIAKQDPMIGRAGLFFAEAILIIEKTHRGAREADLHMSKIVKTLSERTLEQADSVQKLKTEISRRKAVEKSLRVSELTTKELLEKSRVMEENLRQLSRQLLSAQEEERRKISREMHDVIGQTLTGIGLQLEALKTATAADTKGLQKIITHTQRIVESSVETVHCFARELRPSLLDDLGLIPALESYVKDFAADTGVRVRLHAFASIEQADIAWRTTLYRITQEALKNVARHAKATQVAISIRQVKCGVHMEIKDDGCGFAVEGKGSATPHKRLGMLGMQERIEMIGGTFHVESATGGPTTIRVEIPAKSIQQN
jgi:signal transduction histidine kinase